MINFLLSIPAIVWLLISSVFFAAGEFLSKKWGVAPGIKPTVFVMLAYGLSSLFWLPSLLHKNQLAIMGTFWLVLATISTVLIGIVVFHEKLNTLQWVGFFWRWLPWLCSVLGAKNKNHFWKRKIRQGGGLCVVLFVTIFPVLLLSQLWLFPKQL